jgi:hypothetical protein
MALIDRTKDLKEYIEANKKYIAYNTELFDIYEGNLRPYVDEILRNSLSKEYYQKIQDRIYPINILKRIIDKISRVYSNNPIRTATNNEDLLSFYETSYMINSKMNMADEYSNLFKGYALEPYLKNGIPALRVLPFDRFIVESNSIIDQTIMTRFYKYIGKYKTINRGQNKEVDVWFVYTSDEFVAIDNEGNIIPEFMKDDLGNELNGENPLGFIPFYYGNKSEYKIMPTQDTDTLSLSKLLPVQLSDLSGTILFQCFSIMYAIDIDAKNLTMSPNAFWSIKSDTQSDKNPQIGAITPTADVNKVLDFIGEAFSLWMESRGIRVGAMGRVDGTFNSSGISKIIDEMDTSDSIKKQIQIFKKDEYQFWQLTKKMNNHWAETGQLKINMLPDDWEVFTEFDDPRPNIGRSEEIDNAIKERDAGFISTDTAIKKLYPDWSEKDIEDEKIKMQGQF